MHIQGKVVLITGASEGIGAACADAFGQRGARLALTSRSLAPQTAEDRIAISGDLTKAEDRKRIVEETVSHYGRIDVLVNNAGVGLYAPAWRAPLDSVRNLFELNVFALLDMVQLVVPHMRRQASGMIVNVGSIAGKMTLPWLTLYSSTKYAVGAITDGLRMELKRDGIHAMTVCPGYVKTAFQSHVLEGTPPAALQRGKRFAITAAQCAEAIAKGVERDARTVVTPRSGWLLVGLERLLPSVVDAQLEKVYQRAQ